MLPLVFLSLSVFGSVLTCPPVENILPCYCKNFMLNTFLICKGVMNPEVLEVPIQATAVCHYGIDSLSIENSSLLYIPNSIFKNTKFEKIRFLSSEIMSLSDTDLAFEGLENTLQEIRATDAKFTAQWDWQQLRNLKKLELIDVNSIQMGTIPEPFPDLPNLRFLGIIHAQISFILQSAFASLKRLQVLNMEGNEISELTRNMFPEPAYNLLLMDFSDNELSALPEDIFRNMPILEVVKLDKNKFTTLDRKVFSWAIKNLSELTLTGNDFRCDCRIRWMAGGHVPVTFAGECKSPESLAGKQLRRLELKELWC